MCKKLFADAAKKLNCPIRLTSACHPRAPLDVYIDAYHEQIVVCCSKCDRPIAHVTARLRGERARKKR